MIACLDAYPPTYADYLRDKPAAKRRLQPEMQSLLAELRKPVIFRAFLNKALFDGGNADYLTVFPGPAAAPAHQKVFHVFHKDDVVQALTSVVTLRNSKARKASETDDQKVTFWSSLRKKNIGEIEDRHDGPVHYKEMKVQAQREWRLRNSDESDSGQEPALPASLRLRARREALQVAPPAAGGPAAPPQSPSFPCRRESRPPCPTLAPHPKIRTHAPIAFRH